jgi:hypothetical protein
MAGGGGRAGIHTDYVETTLLSKILFIVMVTLTFDPKINRVLPLPQGNHVTKFGKDLIYRIFTI